MALLSSLESFAIPNDRFSYSDNTFTAEISNFKDSQLHQQIYDDACDVGFAIRSTQTGCYLRFYLEQLHKDSEGDITHWTYKPIAEDVRKNPNYKFLSVVIFND